MLLLFSAAVLPVFGNETAAVWARIYEGTDQLDAKIDVMRSIVELHDRDMEPVLTKALEEIVFSRDEA